LKLKYDEPPSNFAFNLNLRRYGRALKTMKKAGGRVKCQMLLAKSQGAIQLISQFF
jgi:hypothetical protein